MKINHSHLSVYFLMLGSLSAQACIDPPTPVQLTQSTFEKQKMSVDSGGLHFGNGTLHYNLKKSEWCWIPEKNGKAGEEKCEVGAKVKLQNKDKAVVGVIILDNEKKKAVLYQVKEPVKVGDYELDKESARMEFEDQSDPLDNRRGKNSFVTTAIDPKDGVLGSVTSNHVRGARAVAGPARETVLDLREKNKSIAGCGQVEVVPEPPPRKKSEFKKDGPSSRVDDNADFSSRTHD